MSACMWECLKWALGFWGAVLLLGLLITAITAAIVASGGTAGAVAVPLLEGILATTAGAAGVSLATAGAVGSGGSLIGCLAGCLYATS